MSSSPPTPPQASDTSLPPWDAADPIERAPDDDPCWDLAVVGAGITGAGVALDATLRGLSVVVLEARDVAYGTSSRSSRLIHGGVRYLERGDLKLVHEALRERARLYQNASHLVQPARFLFPTYRRDRLGPWRLRIGLALYDLLALYRGSQHEFLTADRVREVEPLLQAEGLQGAVEYEDAITDDARLTLTVLQAARRHGAHVATYTPVHRIDTASDGFRLAAGDGSSIRARQCVVAVGPWTGPTLLGDAGRNLLSLSKGIHLVLRASDVPVRQPVVIQASRGQRVLFVVPWGNRTYVGTTDEPYEGDPGCSGVTATDERNLLRTVARRLSGARLQPERIISAWSGVRPLVRPPGTNPAETEQLSRRHRVVTDERGVLGVVGGKLTTYRAMAEEIVDRVVANLGRTAKSTTANHPLVPEAPLTTEELADPLVGDLAPRHGPLARTLARRANARPGLQRRMIDDLPYRWIEVVQAIEYEGCRHLDDILRRRLPLALTDEALGGTVAADVARMLIDARGGDQRDIDAEMERYRRLIHTETGRAVGSPAASRER